jgi:hypothetical protein
MNTIKLIVFSISILLMTNSVYSQRSRGNGNKVGRENRHKNTKVVVKNNHRQSSRVVIRSPYRPAKVAVYHAHWRPNYSYHRRWVYFPRYNFYWDNWRQGYYYRNGAVWMFNVTPPPVIVNVNLEKEPNYELREDDDDVDDVYKTNDTHVNEFRTDSIK